MSVNQTSRFRRDEQLAALIGALVGGLLAGAFMQVLGGADAMVTFAWLIGSTDPGVGIRVWLVLAIVFGLFFGIAMARTVNKFTNTVIMVSRKSRVTQKLLVPLLHESALGLTAGSMGLIYGQVLGFGFYAYVTPLIARAQGIPAEFVQANFVVIFGYIIYAQTLGTVYGKLLEAEWFPPGDATPDAAFLGASIYQPLMRQAGLSRPLLSEEQIAGLKAAPVAGLVSGVGILLLILTGYVPSSDPLLQAVGLWRGFAVWMGLSVLFGLVFVAYVARTINDFTNTVIMFSRRSKLTQKILVPLITRAALTTTASSMGLGFGAIVGVLFYLAALLGPIPATTPLVVLAFVLYGQVLGVNYGLQLEEVDLSLPFGGVEPEPDPAETDESDPLAGKQGFAAWRVQRPFAGSAMLILAGFIIGAIPIRIQQTFPNTTSATVGIAFAAMVVACGLFALFKPELSTLIGVTGIAMSILSLIGAFGGLVIGMLVGILGGSLCVAWQDPNRDEEAAQESRFKWIGEGEQQW